MPDSSVEILRFETYLQMIKNSVGTEKFKNFYILDKKTGKPKDICKNGENSCAFFVSSILTLAGYDEHPHLVVDTVMKELKQNGWVTVSDGDLVEGDVIFWEEADQGDSDLHKHVGFYIGSEKAVSTSWKKRKVITHHFTFGKAKGSQPKRKIELISDKRCEFFKSSS